jgi:hypothetical protein
VLHQQSARAGTWRSRQPAPTELELEAGKWESRITAPVMDERSAEL